MSTIVFHSSSLGVTEYDRTLRGLAGDNESDRAGVYLVHGEDDDGLPFVSRFSLPLETEGQNAKRVPMSAYVQADTPAQMSCTVSTNAVPVYTYAQQFLSERTRRFIFGRGIRDSYLGFSFFNPLGEAFKVDRVEINTRDSAQRKV